MIKRRYFIHVETRSYSTGETLKQSRLFTHTSWLPSTVGALDGILIKLKEFIASNCSDEFNPDDMIVISFSRC